MATSEQIISTTYQEAQELVKDAILADVPVLMWGAPGLGKTSLYLSLAQQLKLPPRPFLGSSCDPTDVGGFPVVKADSFDRIPMKIIRQCIDQPGLLIIDELTTCPGPVQATLLRLFLERWAGDYRLHPETRVVAASNQPEHAPGASPISAALGGRVLQLKLAPSVSDVEKFFLNFGDPNTRLHEEAVDFATTLKFAPNLLQMEPPPASVSQGLPWGAPRNWEHAVRCMAVVNPKSQDARDRMFRLAASAVGISQAEAYFGIRDLKDKLPSVDQIISDPLHAPVPPDRAYQVAVSSVILRVHERSPGAAWVYLERLDKEIRAAIARPLMTKKAPQDARGKTAYENVVSQIGQDYFTKKKDEKKDEKKKAGTVKL